MECGTCRIRLIGQENFVKFPCPSCGEFTVVRCSRCKRLSNRYTCPKCGFEGP